MIVLKNIFKAYKDKKIINDFSYYFSNKFYQIIGKSGCGKTTLARIILGLDKNYKGEVYYDGRNLKEITKNEQKDLLINDFAYISQDSGLIESLTVLENLELALSFSNKEFDMDKILDILDDFDLYGRRMNKVTKLSGGERKRLAILSAVLKNSKVIVADEPFSSLDEEVQVKVYNMLKEYSKEHIVIIINHDSRYTDSDFDETINFSDLVCKNTEDIKKSTLTQDKKKLNNSFLYPPLLGQNIKRSISTNFISLLLLSIIFFTLFVTTTTLNMNRARLEKRVLDESIFSSFMVFPITSDIEESQKAEGVISNIDSILSKDFFEVYVDNKFEFLRPKYYQIGSEQIGIIIKDDSLSIGDNQAIATDFYMNTLIEQELIDLSNPNKYTIYGQNENVSVDIIEVIETNYQEIQRHCSKEEWINHSYSICTLYVNSYTFSKLIDNNRTSDNYFVFSTTKNIELLSKHNLGLWYYQNRPLIDVTIQIEVYYNVGKYLSVIMIIIYLLFVVLAPDLASKNRYIDMKNLSIKGANFTFFLKNYLLVNFMVVTFSLLAGFLVSIYFCNYLNTSALKILTGIYNKRIYNYNVFSITVIMFGLLFVVFEIGYYKYKLRLTV